MPVNFFINIKFQITFWKKKENMKQKKTKDATLWEIWFATHQGHKYGGEVFWTSFAPSHKLHKVDKKKSHEK